jgi:putative DNA primase/helicase
MTDEPDDPPRAAWMGNLPPTITGHDPVQAEINRLATLPELEFDQLDIAAKARELGLANKAILSRAVGRARRAAKAEARERKAEAKTVIARAQLDAQRTLTDDHDDPLHDWRPPHRDALPTITVAGGERPAIANAALLAMKRADVPFYQYGRDLVRICLINLKLSNGKKATIPAISPVTPPMMLRALGLAAKWLAINKKLEPVQIDPPADVATHILGMIGEWPFPPLRGIIATQTMRYDGTLLTRPGYDPDTGLVLFNPPPMPPIPDQPTKREALEALALLNGLLDEVKFAEDNNVSRAAAISMLMTPVLRGLMQAAPLHVVNKPAPGTGGSYMQDLMAAIAIGEPCPVLSLTLNNDEENEKRLSAAAFAGQPIIAIDNIVGTLQGQFLCQLVERPTPQIRLLGKSELVTIHNNHCVVANGNNVAIAADMVRRTLQISLDANQENPENRTFSRNPVAEVLANRGQYVAAVLTIARAYRCHGSPGKLPPRMSFAEWSDNVRSPIHALGYPDCDISIASVQAADPIANQLHAVISAWANNLKIHHGYRTTELVSLASDCSLGERLRPDLWDALADVATNKAGQLDPKTLGRWLEANLNRVSAHLKIIVDRADKARPKWKLEPL